MRIARRGKAVYLCSRNMQILKDDTRRRILTQSRKLFLEKGFRDTTTRDIAQASGAVLSSLYRYFSSKDDLFLYIVKPAMSALEDMLERHHNPGRNDIAAIRSDRFVEDSLMVDHIGYERLTVVGGDVAVPFGNFVFRGELADYISSAGTHQGNALGALDWYPGADWNVSVQVNGTFGAGEASTLGTLRISKALLSNALTLSTFAYADLRDLGVFNRLSADWAVCDEVHALLGYDLFAARGGMFERYKNNSEVWVKVKYSF